MKHFTTNYFPKLLFALMLIVATQFVSAQQPNFYYGDYWTHTCAVNNQAGNWTVLDRADVNGNPNALVIFTPNWQVAGIYNDFNSGLWYTGANWAIYKEINDGSQIPTGSGFNVLRPTTNGSIVQHVTDAGNITNEWTRFSHPGSDNNPNAMIYVSHNWGASGGVYFDHPIGVWYDGTYWCIYAEDLATMPEGVVFNVFVSSAVPSDAFPHVSTSANTVNNYTLIDNSRTNGNPNAVIFAIHNYSFSSPVMDNNSPIGVWYDGGQWSVFNQNLAAMTVGLAFNILITDQNTVGSTAEVGASEMRVSVYPNPATSEININYQTVESGAVTLKLFGLNGQLLATLHEGHQGKGTYLLSKSVSDLANGTYFLVLNVNGKITRESLVIAR